MGGPGIDASRHVYHTDGHAQEEKRLESVGAPALLRDGG
jgi:hypothetical protein